MVAVGQAVTHAILQVRAPVWDPRLTWAAAGLAGLLLVGAAVIAIVKRWWLRPREDHSRSQDQLSSYRELYERGELSQEEYERIRNRLTARVRKELDIAPRLAAPPEPPPPTAPPSEG